MKMKHISPFLPVCNVSNAIEFYSDVLGFECKKQTKDHAWLSRDGVALHLVKANVSKDMKSPDSQLHCYIEVEGVDDLFISMKDKLAALPEGRVRKPFNTSYGQREFHVIDMDVTLFAFGEKTDRSPSNE